MNKLNQFTIKILIPPDSMRSIDMTMSPGEHVMEIASRLSLAYKDHDVDVTMFQRVRRTYLNGKAIKSNPYLLKFTALELTERDLWDWTCYGREKC